jgi:hypothetical protein
VFAKKAVTINGELAFALVRRREGPARIRESIVLYSQYAQSTRDGGAIHRRQRNAILILKQRARPVISRIVT